MYFSRIFLLVLDSVGIGALPDASEYGDSGTNTLGNISKYMNGLNMPNLESFGLGNLATLEGVSPVSYPLASFGIMKELSKGKDTTTGHWELMGVNTNVPFITFPEGFPASLINQIKCATSRGVIGNYPASGTEIISKLGSEHINTGKLIIYTSADSVLQIAAHEDVVPLNELYDICLKVRELTLQEQYKVTRVIARPFIGTVGNFVRTGNRRDYSVKPPHKTTLNYLSDNDIEVIGVGKISDIFAEEGLTQSYPTKSNDEGVEKTISLIKDDFKGLCFVNLVDFDAKFGHRRDPEGYAKSLETFDKQLAEITNKLKKDDLLIITADHGNDPTHPGTDHTREYVPLLVFNPYTISVNLGVRETFADIGATIAENFSINTNLIGKSFLALLKNNKIK